MQDKLQDQLLIIKIQGLFLKVKFINLQDKFH